MPSLPELQRAFARGVLDDDESQIAGAVRTDQFSAQRHLQIYHNNVFASLTRSMKDVYPVVTRLVSDGFMDYASDSFIRQYPPHSGNLHDFGGEFAAFLTTFPSARELVYLPDIARLEWAFHLAFHAADATPHAAEHLRAADPARYGELRFVLHPSVHLVASDYPIRRIWESNQPGFAGDDRVDLDEGQDQVLVIRRKTVELHSISPGAFALLTAFALGEPFAKACEAALNAEGSFDLGRTLQTFAVDGTIVDIVRPGSNHEQPD